MPVSTNLTWRGKRAESRRRHRSTTGHERLQPSQAACDVIEVVARVACHRVIDCPNGIEFRPPYPPFDPPQRGPHQRHRLPPPHALTDAVQSRVGACAPSITLPEGLPLRAGEGVLIEQVRELVGNVAQSRVLPVDQGRGWTQSTFPSAMSPCNSLSGSPVLKL